MHERRADYISHTFCADFRKVYEVRNSEDDLDGAESYRREEVVVVVVVVVVVMMMMMMVIWILGRYYILWGWKVARSVTKSGVISGAQSLHVTSTVRNIISVQ